jgi:SAM-dependent methyltransferase
MHQVKPWKNRIVSFAYQYQKEAKPFKDMMKVFASEITAHHHMTIMDIGCGSGRIIYLILNDLKLNPRSIDALDISHYALHYAQRNIKKLPYTCPVVFHQADISSPGWYNKWSNNTFDLITAGLAIQYAQYWNEEKKQWTTDAYEKALKAVYDLLKPGGQFVFSVNVPHPDFSLIAKKSKKEILTSLWKAPLRLFVALIMVRHGKKRIGL